MIPNLFTGTLGMGIIYRVPILDKWQLLALIIPYIICEMNLSSGHVSPEDILSEKRKIHLFRLVDNISLSTTNQYLHHINIVIPQSM